jgi:hypothetical protein
MTRLREDASRAGGSLAVWRLPCLSIPRLPRKVLSAADSKSCLAAARFALLPARSLHLRMLLLTTSVLPRLLLSCLPFRRQRRPSINKHCILTTLGYLEQQHLFGPPLIPPFGVLRHITAAF